MKKTIITCIFVTFFYCANAQLGVKYDSSVQTTKDMQYFKPTGNLNVGDCMPFYHDGLFSSYWLVDSLHGENLHGLGGHQWVLSTSRDLKVWKQEPIVLGIDEDWEKSICTGSIVYNKGTYYAFYATRLINKELNNQVNEQLSYATSKDGIHFEKHKPNPFYTSAPGYSKRDFRDPKVSVDQEGVFHLFVASDQNDPILRSASGCLVHMISKDLKKWTVLAPILTGQPTTPECPDYFYWKGWYYLVYSDNSNTYYLKSKSAYGPWQEPRYQTLNEDWANVVKTAAYHNDRRLAVAWIPDRYESKDNQHEIFGGNMIFREVVQEPDGTLDTKFPEEMIPSNNPAINEKITPANMATLIGSNGVYINAPGAVGSAYIKNIPQNCRITLQITPTGPNEDYGLLLKADAAGDQFYKFDFSANASAVRLGNTAISGVQGLNKSITLDIVIKDGIIDADIDHRRTIVNRTYELKGDVLWFYAKHGNVMFKNINIYPLKKD